MEGSPDSPDLDACVPAPSHRDSERCCLPCRYALTILSGSGFCVLFMMRVNLSVAIVAMVNSTYADAKASANSPECQRDKVKTASVKVSLPVLGLTLLKKGVSLYKCYERSWESIEEGGGGGVRSPGGYSL